MLLFLRILCVFSTLFFSWPGSCVSRDQEGGAKFFNKIAAVVGKTPISFQDIAKYTKFVVLSSGLQDSAESQAHMRPLIIQTLIDAELKRQVASSFGIVIDDQAIASAIGELEVSGQMPTGSVDQFFQETGVERDCLEKQLRARLAWTEYMKERYGHAFYANIGDEEVAAFRERWKQNSRSPRYHCYEIVLHFDQKNEKIVEERAKTLMKSLVGGASFPGMAQRFSQSPSAMRGGDIGWFSQEDLEHEGWDSYLGGMEIGHIIGPLKTPGQFIILGLIDKKIPDVSSESESLSDDEIRRRLWVERIESMDQKEMETLRKSTLIAIY